MGLRIREGAIITYDLADLINAVAAERRQEPITPESRADLNNRTGLAKHGPPCISPRAIGVPNRAQMNKIDIVFGC